MPFLVGMPPLLTQLNNGQTQISTQPKSNRVMGAIKDNELDRVLDKIEQMKFSTQLTTQQSTPVDIIKTKLQEKGITDPKEVAQFLATAKVESNFKFTPENLAGYKNTDTSRIRKIFKNKVKNLSDEDIDRLKQQPEKLFDVIYKDLGGSKYRGRGPLQITGVKNYELISNQLFGDNRLVQNPELLENPETAINASIEFWKLNNLGEIGRQKGFDEVQRLINVGPKGSLSRVQDLDKRRKFFNQYFFNR